MRTLGYVLVAVLLIAVLLSVAFGLEWAGLKWKGFFGPKHEDVRREVFKRTRSYNEGKEQQLIKYRLEYLRATTPQDREAVAGTIRMAFADYDESLIDSPGLRGFLRDIKAGKESVPR